MVGENSTNYSRPTAKRPSFNPKSLGSGVSPAAGRVQGGRMEILARQLVKAIQSTCEATGFMVHGVNMVEGRRLATVDIGTTSPIEQHQRAALQAAISRVWGGYTYSEKQGLGYEVTLNGSLISRCS